MSLRNKARAVATLPHKTENPANEKPNLLKKDKLASREEALLAIFEIFKEIASPSEEIAIFRSIATGIMAHLAVPAVALFFKKQDRYLLQYAQGYQLPIKTYFPQGKLPNLLLQQNTLIHSDDLLKHLTPEEKVYLSGLAKSIIVPAIQSQQLLAFALVALPSQVDFTEEEILFLKLLGETLAAFYYLVERLVFLASQERLYHLREANQALFNEFTYRLAYAANPKEADLLLTETLNEKFGMKMYVLLLKEDYFFKVYLAQGLRRQSLANFEMAMNDPLLQELQQSRGWQIHNNFRDDSRLSNRLNEQDLQLAEGLEILPLHHSRELKGCLFLFLLAQKLSGDERYYLQAILQSWLFHKLSTTAPSQPQVESAYQPLKRRLHQAEEKLTVHGTPYMVALIQIVNLDRLERIFNSEYILKLRNQAINIIQQHLSKQDFCLELLHGQFFFLAEGVTSTHAFKLTRQIQKEISELHPREELAPLVRSKFFCRPEQELPELEKFLQI